MRIRTFSKKLLSQFPLLDGLFRRYVWSRIHFPEIEMRFLNALQAGSVDVAVDVGAALGSYSWILNRISKQVYAFEPGIEHNKYLNRLVFLTNISVIPVAVGSGCGHVSLYTPGSDSHALHSATLSQDNPVVNSAGISINQVDQVTLDTFLADKLAPGQTVDVLKVDVEGYELDVFIGAVEILSNHHPFIICEIEARHNANYPEIFIFLKKLGYDCYIYRAGAFELFVEKNIEHLQLEEDLEVRLSSNNNSKSNRYINNFVFRHPKSRIEV